MRPWFKHYNNSSKKKIFKRLENEVGVHQAYSFYWRFTEYFHSIWDGKSEPIFEISLADLNLVLRCKSTSSRLFLRCLSEASHIQLGGSELLLKIKFDKISEIQDKDSKYNRKRIANGSQSATLEEEEEKEEEKEDIPTHKNAVQKEKKEIGSDDFYSDSVNRALGTKDSPEKEVRPLVKKFLEIFNNKPSESLIDRNISTMSHFLKKNSISKEEMDKALDNRLDTMFDDRATIHFKQPHCSLDSFLKGYDRYSPQNYKRENQWKHEDIALQEDKKYVDIVNNLFLEEDKKRGVSK